MARERLYQRGSKYHNKIVYEDNICFRSLLELKRYRELKLLAHAGAITQLRVHTRWKLIVGGVLIGTYEDDFDYRDNNGTLIVEDTKSEPTRTETYKIKKRLMKVCHGIDIIEIFA